jgi:hypothetical protein
VFGKPSAETFWECSTPFRKNWLIEVTRYGVGLQSGGIIGVVMKAPSAKPQGNRRAVAGRNGKTNSSIKPSHVEFECQNRASLPEVITEDDLRILNEGLRHLFDRLREAGRQFDSEGDDGRQGAFTALAATWRFISLFKEPFAECLQVPILHSQQAVASLENNVVLPILKPVPKDGRAVSSYSRAAVRGCAVGTVQRLLDNGMSLGEAHQAVAQVLDHLGIRPERGGGKITGTTVRHWCGDVAEDVGRHGMAAFKYDTMFTRSEREKLSALPNDEAKLCYVLDRLAAYVEALLPGQENPPKTPI